MHGHNVRSWLSAAALGLGLTLASGCQTQDPETLMTLPTGDYLRHLPQYVPPTPGFPLTKEEYNLEQAVAQPPNALPRPLVGPPPGP